MTTKQKKAASDKPAKAKQKPKAQPAADVSAPAEVAAAEAARTPAPADPAPAGDAKSAKMSALDAAAKVLGEDGGALNTKDLIERMGARAYWVSPGGKTPASTLYSALLREITTKGGNSRFKKAERGKFALNATA